MWAVGLFAYAGITDLLDGWIARRWNRKTVVGTIIDPLADKALMTILTVCLATKGALPCTCFICNGVVTMQTLAYVLHGHHQSHFSTESMAQFRLSKPIPRM